MPFFITPRPILPTLCNMENQKNFIKEIKNFGDYDLMIERKYVKKIILLCRDFINEIPMSCGTNKCSSCCCNNCDCNHGYFKGSKLSQRIFFLFKDEIKKVLNKRDSVNWKGFLNPKKGCMLPLHIRSIICLSYVGYSEEETLYCYPKKFKHIVKIYTSLLRKAENDFDKYRNIYSTFNYDMLTDLISLAKKINKKKG